MLGSGPTASCIVSAKQHTRTRNVVRNVARNVVPHSAVVNTRAASMIQNLELSIRVYRGTKSTLQFLGIGDVDPHVRRRGRAAVENDFPDRLFCHIPVVGGLVGVRQGLPAAVPF